MRELRHGGCRGDGEGAEADAAHKDVGGVFGHADAGQTATGNLVRREDGAAVKSHRFGDIDFDDTKIGLDEGIVHAHVRGQFLEASAQHRVELLVDGAEVGPLSADVHLLLAAARRDGFDRGFADDGTHFGLSVDVLAYLATDLCIDSEYFCHCVVPFFVKGLYFSFPVFVAWPTCAPAAWLRKTGQKYRGCKNQIRGLSGLGAIKEGKGGYGGIRIGLEEG